MKYALIQCVNGNFSIVSEHGDNLQAARVAFHDRCKILWNASDVTYATIGIITSDLTYVDGRIETISHQTNPDTEE